MIERFGFFFFIAIVIVGLFLRSINLSTIPRHGATFDEFAWTWLGVSLIQEGVPISWSSHPQYKNRQEIRYQGAAFILVKPYLEHPPLFGLVAGSFALVNGSKDMFHVTLDKMRPLGLLLGVISVTLIFFLVKELYDLTAALIASGLYATVPTVVIGSRLVQNENFLILFWLLSLYLVVKYLRKDKKLYRNLAILFCSILPLAKVPWFVAPFSIFLIFLYKGKKKDALLTLIFSLLFFSLFLIYGLHFNKELFLNLWKFQLARYDISFSGFFSIFTNPLLVDRKYLDGWIFFGWLSIILLGAKDLKKNFIILIPFLAYLVLYIFVIPNEPSHGWYRYPFYPFLLISSAIFIREEISKLSILSSVFLFIVGLSLMFNTWETSFGFSYLVYRFFILFWSLPLLFVFFPNKKTKIISRGAFLVSILSFIILNYFSIVNFNG